MFSQRSSRLNDQRVKTTLLLALKISPGAEPPGSSMGLCEQCDRTGPPNSRGPQFWAKAAYSLSGMVPYLLSFGPLACSGCLNKLSESSRAESTNYVLPNMIKGLNKNEINNSRTFHIFCPRPEHLLSHLIPGTNLTVCRAAMSRSFSVRKIKDTSQTPSVVLSPRHQSLPTLPLTSPSPLIFP